MEGHDLAQAVTDGDGGAQAEAVEQRQAGERVGGDRRLRHRRVDGVRRRVEPGLGVDRLQVLEPPSQQAAVEVGGGALAGEEEADPPPARAAVGDAEERAVARVEAGRFAAAQPGGDAAQALGGLGGGGGDHRRARGPRRAVPQDLLQARREVGQLSAREAGRDPGQPLGLVRQGVRVHRGEQQQLGVLPGGEQLALARRQRPPAGAGSPSIARCALIPPNPMAETPARSGRPAGQGSPPEARNAAAGPVSCA